METMVFKGTKIEMITRNGEVWLRGPQIGGALGYRDPSKKIAGLYGRHADEFTETMTAVIQLPTDGGMQKIRVFSLRGTHLLAMLARTDKAKEFRRWVLDILDALHQGGDYVRHQYESASASLEDRRIQASDEGRGLSRWKQDKRAMESRAEYWQERLQLSLALDS